MFDPRIFEGTTVDQFELQCFIARGAMGMVFKAFDTVIKRPVALKVILKNDDIVRSSTEVSKRFIQEAQAAGRISHPNIVTIYSYGETEDLQYICMEYIDGKTLAEILEQVGSLDVMNALAMFESILMALDAASQHGIVHRDIKPSNIMITGNGVIKVMDFGIARLPSLDKSMTVTGTVLGTPYYMSPEQISGEKVDIRSDIFSVGTVLYQVLSGKRPFTGESTAAISYKIVHVEPASLNELIPLIPQDVCDLVNKALVKDPSERYQTPVEMLQDLRTAMLRSSHQTEIDVGKFAQANDVQPLEEEGGKVAEALEEPTTPAFREKPSMHQFTSTLSPEKKSLLADTVPESLHADLQMPVSPPPTVNGELSLKKMGVRVKVLTSGTVILLGLVVGIILVANRTNWSRSGTPPPPDQVVATNESRLSKASTDPTVRALSPPVKPHDGSKQVNQVPVSERVRDQEGQVEAESFPEVEKGKLTIQLDPPDANVRFSNEEGTYKDAMDIAAGRHMVEVSRAGYKARTVELNVVAAQDNIVAVHLEKIEQLQQANVHLKQDTPPTDSATVSSTHSVQPAVSGQKTMETASSEPPLKLTKEKERQNRVDALLAKSEEAYRKNRITAPKGDNVLHYYKAAFALDPQDERIFQATLKMAKENLTLASSTSEKKDIRAAKWYLTRAQSFVQVIPKSSAELHRLEVDKLRSRIDDLTKSLNTPQVSPKAPQVDPSKDQNAASNKPSPSAAEKEPHPKHPFIKPKILKEEFR